MPSPPIQVDKDTILGEVRLGEGVQPHMPLPSWMNNDEEIMKLDKMRTEMDICLPGHPSSLQGWYVADMFETDSYRVESNRSGK